MDKWKKVAIVAGGVTAIAAAGAIIAGGGIILGDSFLLQIETFGGGTTLPAPSPSGVRKAAGTEVTITAVPENGYSVGNWTVDGQTLSGQAESITVTMDRDHWVTVSFWEGGVPPVSAPAFVVPLSGTSTAIGYYACRIDVGPVVPYIDNISVHNTDQNWTWDNWAQDPIQFKVIDAEGRGVPNVKVHLWPDIAPDAGNNVGLVGFLALNLYPHTRNEPLELTTDSNGIVTATMTYTYAINDAKKKLCEKADLRFSVLVGGVYPQDYHPYDGGQATVTPGAIFTGKSGDGLTNQTPTMGGYVVNYVKASIPGTGIPQTQLAVYCGYHVKME